MVVCEVFGLPGGGKSFYCGQLKKKYNEQEVVRSIEEQKKTFIGKCIVKLRFKVSKLRYRKLAKFLKSFLKGKANLFAKEISPKYMIEHICYCVSIYRKNTSRIYFFDEGIIHCLSALGAEYGLSFEVLKQIFDKIESYIKFNDIYYLEISVENALKRIKIRNRHACYMDNLKDEDLIELLKNYEKNMKAFYGILSGRVIKINMDSEE